MKLNTILAGVLLGALSVAHAQQHKHVHGEGQLDIAIDKEIVTLSLELPLDAAVGFERPPKNDKEKAALASTAKLLNDGAALFRTTPEAQCALQTAQVQVPFTGGDDRHGHHAHEGEQHHADITATYTLRCAVPTKLTFIETTLFTHFKRLYRLEARRVGPSGQGAQRLTPKKPQLVWSVR